MDEIDVAILERLTEDARTSFRKIAKEVGVSPDTVMSRYLAMQKSGHILSSTIIIEPRTIGYQALGIFMIHASTSRGSNKEPAPQDTSSIFNALTRTPSVFEVARTVGDHDLIATVGARDLEHLIKLRNIIAKIPGVKDIQISYWTEFTEFPELCRHQEHIIHSKEIETNNSP
jgi:DNA-binding Lrp family transcriptional regulator